MIWSAQTHLVVRVATPDDAPTIASMRVAVADDLTERYGRGHWSLIGTERGVVRDIQTSCVLVGCDGATIVGTLRLATKKPWAIDPKYFTNASRPLYLLDMAVDPVRQRQGIGRHLVEQAKAVAAAWPSDAIRLDAYEAAAGAGGFYAKCGFREVGRVTYRGVPLIYFEHVLG
jgi:GNAT superfamily N-acetyltransferase